MHWLTCSKTANTPLLPGSDDDQLKTDGEEPFTRQLLIEYVLVVYMMVSYAVNDQFRHHDSSTWCGAELLLTNIPVAVN